jgi:cytochrome c oxidase assembly factor CtaG
VIGTLHVAGADGHHDLWTAWSADVAVLAGAAVALTLYAMGWTRLRRRGRRDLADARRAVAFTAGVVLVVLSVVSPLDEIGERYLLWGHMGQHLLLADLGPLLMAAGLMGPLSVFVVPRVVLRGLSPTRPARAVLGVLGKPVSAFVVWALVMVGWHVPAAYEYALAHRWAHDLQHATMLSAGLLVWIHILAAVPRLHASPARRAGLAVAVFAVGMVIAQVLFLSDPLYDVYIDQPDRLLGLSPAGDQARAGLLMGTEQAVTLGLAAFLLMWVHLERVGGDPEPGASPAARP